MQQFQSVEVEQANVAPVSGSPVVGTSEIELKRYDEQAQRDIIARAAELQREHGNRASLSELERAALEAGIEPRFVREAVRQRETAPPQVAPPHTNPGSSQPAPQQHLGHTYMNYMGMAPTGTMVHVDEPINDMGTLAVWQTIVTTLLFLPVEYLVIVRGFASYSAPHGQVLIVAVVLAAIYGLVLPRNTMVRRLAAALPLAMVFFAYTFGRRLLPYEMYEHGALLPTLWVAALQGAIATMIHILRTRAAGRQTREYRSF